MAIVRDLIDLINNPERERILLDELGKEKKAIIKELEEKSIEQKIKTLETYRRTVQHMIKTFYETEYRNPGAFMYSVDNLSFYPNIDNENVKKTAEFAINAHQQIIELRKIQYETGIIEGWKINKEFWLDAIIKNSVRIYDRELTDEETEKKILNYAIRNLMEYTIAYVRKGSKPEINKETIEKDRRMIEFLLSKKGAVISEKVQKFLDTYLVVK